MTASYNVLLQNDAFSATTGIVTGNRDIKDLIGPDSPIFIEQGENGTKTSKAKQDRYGYDFIESMPLDRDEKFDSLNSLMKKGIESGEQIIVKMAT